MSLYRVIDWDDFSAIVAGSELRDQLKFFLKSKKLSGVNHHAADEYTDYELYALNDRGEIIVAFDSKDRELVEEFLTSRDS